MDLAFLVWVIFFQDNITVRMAALSCGGMACGLVEGGLVVFRTSVLA